MRRVVLPPFGLSLLLTGCGLLSGPSGDDGSRDTAQESDSGDPTDTGDDTGGGDDTGDPTETCEAGDLYTRCDGDDVILCDNGTEARIDCPDTCGSDPDVDHWCQGEMPSTSLSAGYYGDANLSRFYTWIAQGDLEFDRLELDAGTTLLVKPLSTLTVNDALLAPGTKSRPVRIASSKSSPGAGDWERLILGLNHQSRLDHTTIEHFRGIDSAGDLDLFDCTIQEVEVDGALGGAVHQENTTESSYSVLRVVRSEVNRVSGGDGIHVSEWVDLELQDCLIQDIDGAGVYIDAMDATVSDTEIQSAQIGLSAVYTNLSVAGLSVSDTSDYGLVTERSWGSVVDAEVTGSPDFCFGVLEWETSLSTAMDFDHVSCSGASTAAFRVNLVATRPGDGLGSVDLSAYDVRDTPAFMKLYGHAELSADGGNAVTSKVFTSDSDSDWSGIRFQSDGAYWNGKSAGQVEAAFEALVPSASASVTNVAGSELSGVGAR